MSTLSPQFKQLLLSASAAALKLSQSVQNRMHSFANKHIECKRALQEQMIIYKHAILLLKLYNNESPEIEWIALNYQQILTTRQTKFSVIKATKKRIGNNILTNRMHVLNNKINLLNLNKSLL